MIRIREEIEGCDIRMKGWMMSVIIRRIAPALVVLIMILLSLPSSSVGAAEDSDGQEVAVFRYAHGPPRDDALTMTMTAQDDGELWVLIRNGGLSVIRLEICDITGEIPVLLWSERILFQGEKYTFIESGSVTVQEDRTYSVKAVPYGKIGTYAILTMMTDFIAAA